MGKTADQFQSYHQDGGTLLVLSVVLPCLEDQFRCLLVSALLRCAGMALINGSFQKSQREPKGCCLDMGRYRDTGSFDDMRRSGSPKATTAVDDCSVRISARRYHETNATILNNAFRAATGRRV